MKKLARSGLFLLVVGSVLVFGGYRWYRGSSNSNDFITRWLRNPAANEQLHTDALVRCGDAPFIIPSSGFIGLLWRDPAAPYNSVRRHTGVDIFGRGESGSVPIYAAYDGWLTRLDNWTSTVVIGASAIT